MGSSLLFSQTNTHNMKLIAASAVAAVAFASQQGALKASNAQSDECAGCENAPEPIFTCLNAEGCDDATCGAMATIVDENGDATASVDCSLAEGYYADASDCRGYCFCSGTDNVDGYGNRVPSRYEQCPEGTVYDAGCSGHHEALANGLGYAGGCCAHPASILNFNNCDGGCERLSKYHCGKSETCSWNAECNCCQAN